MTRQTILKTFVASVLLTLSLTLTAQKINIEAGKNLVGVVSDGTKGVAGVVVSDGYTTTTTNKNGEYQLTRNPRAKHVFISTPNNYNIPVEGNIPAQYKAIRHEYDTIYANFQLNKSAITKDFVLFALADPQPAKLWELHRFRDETIPDINALATTYPAKTSLMGIVVGDLAWDAPKLYPPFVDVVNKLPFPLLTVIGNHDHDQTAIDDDYKASQKFEEFFGPTYYSYNKGDCHFVVLDNMIYSSRKKYENKITQEQLDWLKQDLSHVDKNKLIILGVHVPTNYRGNKLKNADELYAILDGFKVVILSGHTHDGETAIQTENIKEYNINAVFGTGWTGDVGRTGAPNGYAVLEIKGNTVKNEYYKSTGFDKDYQIKLYPLNSWKGKEDGIIAHIWEYHSQWTVDVYEDGKKMEGLAQYKDFDPFAYDYLFGPEKPKHRPNTEPKKTDKLFYYKPENKNAVIKIVATDEFKNVYTSEIDLKK